MKRSGSALIIFGIALAALLVGAGIFYAYYLSHENLPRFIGAPINPLPVSPTSTPPTPQPTSTPTPIATPAPNCTGVSAPAPAANAGYNSLSFCDDFVSMSTIDTIGTGASGYKWYTNRRNQGVLDPSWYSIANSVLTISDKEVPKTINRGLETVDPFTGNGTAWIHGYFEARIKFDPSLGRITTDGWPAVWLNSADRYIAPTGTPHFPELDIFEAVRRPSSTSYIHFLGTVHDWVWPGKAATNNDVNTNNDQAVNVDWNQWHIVAALWKPGSVTWYLDGNPLMTQNYSADGPADPLPRRASADVAKPAATGTFSILDTEALPGLAFVLGSGLTWPLSVDWVRVWH